MSNSPADTVRTILDDIVEVATQLKTFAHDICIDDLDYMFLARDMLRAIHSGDLPSSVLFNFEHVPNHQHDIIKKFLGRDTGDLGELARNLEKFGFVESDPED